MNNTIFNNSHGTLYIDEELFVSGVVLEEITLEPEPQEKIRILPLGEPITGTINFKNRLSNRVKLLLMTGKWFSNNYLKMHGGIMDRHGGKRKKKRRM